MLYFVLCSEIKLLLLLLLQCLKKQADALPADDPKRPEVEGRLSETFMKLGEVSIGEL